MAEEKDFDVTRICFWFNVQWLGWKCLYIRTHEFPEYNLLIELRLIRTANCFRLLLAEENNQKVHEIGIAATATKEKRFLRNIGLLLKKNVAALSREVHK